MVRRHRDFGYQNDIEPYDVVPYNPANDASSKFTGSDMLQNLQNFIGVPAFVLYTFPTILQKYVKNEKHARLLMILAISLVVGRFAIDSVYNFVTRFVTYFTSSVTTSGRDPILRMFQRFMQDKKLWLTDSQLHGESRDSFRDRGVQENMMYEYRYNPSETEMVLFSTRSLQIFRHKGRFFAIRRDDGLFDYNSSSLRRDLRIWCLGFSTTPIKALLEEAAEVSKADSQGLYTPIYTIDLNSIQFDGGSVGWSFSKSAEMRFLEHINLADTIKEDIIADVEQYLDESGKQFYRDRGIPHRRGYLFHGPPGTGKSSFAMAIAGRFDLKIYKFSLSERKLDDEKLHALFRSFDSSTLVLLEDLDCSGLAQPRAPRSPFSPSRSNTPEIRVPARRRTRSRSRRSRSRSRSRSIVNLDRFILNSHGVTLSGLLNAMDGVDSPTGHVLIITTNHPETLDDALIRPGRIDHMVKFGYAGKKQALEMFRRMYKGRNTEATKKMHRLPTLDDEEVERLGERFVEELPEERVSPAELQGFFLLRLNDPEKAVGEARSWAEGVRRNEYGGERGREKKGKPKVKEKGKEMDKGRDKEEKEMQGVKDKVEDREEAGS